MEAGAGIVEAWANDRTPQQFDSLDELHFGFSIFRWEPLGLYPILTSTRIDVPITMLHEFGHNLGLLDLYQGGDVEGCDGLPVIMAGIRNIEASYAYHDQPPRYENVIMNRTWSVWPATDSNGSLVSSEIEEASLFNNTLHFVRYSLLSRPGQSWTGNAAETIYDLDRLGTRWTKEEAAFIGMTGTFPFSCPQELP